jgi:3-oxoacyl-[acyl-carrier-protein] synthase III
MAHPAPHYHGWVSPIIVRRPDTKLGLRYLVWSNQSYEGLIDLFVFHQANKYMLDVLQTACRIPKNKFYACLSNFGNTVSLSIPIALKTAASSGVLHHGARVMLVGFGVGYSWGATVIRWD